MLKVVNISKTFDKRGLSLFNNLCFEIKNGETLCVCGPSGAGKSTLCKMIMGQIKPDSGEIELGKSVAYIPQEMTLDYSMTVFENIATPLYQQKIDESQIHHLVRSQIELFDLPYLDHKYPDELSTGQKQRVEMCKALVLDPDLVILDEPFSHLDPLLKEELKIDLLPILKKRDCALLIVTHDLEDVYSLADKVMLLAEGDLKQYGTPKEIYFHPKCSFAARFSGKINLLAGHITGREGEYYNLKLPLGEFEVRSERKDLGSKFVYMAFRPHAVSICENGEFQAEVIKISFCGSYLEIWLRGSEQNKIVVEIPASQGLKETLDIGSKVRFNLNRDELFLMPI